MFAQHLILQLSSQRLQQEVILIYDLRVSSAEAMILLLPLLPLLLLLAPLSDAKVLRLTHGADIAIQEQSQAVIKTEVGAQDLLKTANSETPGTVHCHHLSMRCMHCPKTNRNLRLKTEPVTTRLDATVLVWFSTFLKPFICSRRDKLGFMQRFRFSFGQCALKESTVLMDALFPTSILQYSKLQLYQYFSFC